MRQQPRLRQFINPTWDKRHFGHSFFSNNALDQHRVSLIRLLIVPSAGFMLGVAVLGTPKRAEGACRRLQMMRRLLSEISQAKENRLALVNLYSFDQVRVRTKNEVGPGIDGATTNRELIVGQHAGNVMDAPVH